MEPPHAGCPFHSEDWERRLAEHMEAMESRSRYTQWLVGVGITVLLVVGGMVRAADTGRIAMLEQYGSPALRERASRVEAELAGVRRDLEELKVGNEKIIGILQGHVVGGMR